MSFCLRNIWRMAKVTLRCQEWDEDIGGGKTDCAKLAAKNTWKALVQVRQKVPHKRTFLFLEQLILKHGAQKDTISVKEVRDGVDFFYSSRSHAQKMVEFLTSVVPVRYVPSFR